MAFDWNRLKAASAAAAGVAGGVARGVVSAANRAAGGRSAKKALIDEPLWFEWAALAGLLVFASWLLGVRGVWALLLSSDPTGLTFIICVVFAISTIWCGSRARELQAQRRLMLLAREAGVAAERDGWAAEYWRALAMAPRDAAAPLDVLLEQSHGPHQTAWWVNGIQLKLGLLGKVIGFSILALHIGQLQSFDAAQSQDLLKSLTTGLGVALLTTMVGLVGNILLGVQLTRLDRFADLFVADCQRHGISRSAAQSH
jgi:hypothetical protein